MNPPLSRADAETLVALCKAGRLYEIDEWIAANKSIVVPPELKRTALQVAVKTGFHSLVELARHATQDEKNAALADAVGQRRLDLIELLVSHNAGIQSVPFADVLLSWEPSVIRFFLDRGADVVTDAPFAEALGERVRTALRPWMECKQRHPELADNLQEHPLCQTAKPPTFTQTHLDLLTGIEDRLRGAITLIAVSNLVEQGPHPAILVGALAGEFCDHDNATKVRREAESG